MLKIKFGDFKQVTRRQTLDDPSCDGQVFFQAIQPLLGSLPISSRGGKSTQVRLCGVSAANLEDRDGPRQLGFDEVVRAKGERLGDVMDQIKDRFGDSGLARANHSKTDKS